MASFENVHRDAMQPKRPMLVGEIWNVAVREPIPIARLARRELPPTEVTLVVAQFRCERVGTGFAMMPTQETEKLIADWNRRHQRTPYCVFGPPDGIFGDDPFLSISFK